MNLEEQDHTAQAEIHGSSRDTWYLVSTVQEEKSNWSCKRWEQSGVLGLLKPVPTSCMNLPCSYTTIFSTSSRPHLVHWNILAGTEEGSQKHRVRSQHHWSQQQTCLFIKEVSTASTWFGQGLPKCRLQLQQERDGRSESWSCRFITSHQRVSMGALMEMRKAPR